MDLLVSLRFLLIFLQLTYLLSTRMRLPASLQAAALVLRVLALCLLLLISSFLAAFSVLLLSAASFLIDLLILLTFLAEHEHFFPDLRVSSALIPAFWHLAILLLILAALTLFLRTLLSFLTSLSWVLIFLHEQVLPLTTIILTLLHALALSASLACLFLRALFIILDFLMTILALAILIFLSFLSSL